MKWRFHDCVTRRVAKALGVPYSYSKIVLDYIVDLDKNKNLSCKHHSIEARDFAWKCLVSARQLYLSGNYESSAKYLAWALHLLQDSSMYPYSDGKYNKILWKDHDKLEDDIEEYLSTNADELNSIVDYYKQPTPKETSQGLFVVDNNSATRCPYKLCQWVHHTLFRQTYNGSRKVLEHIIKLAVIFTVSAFATVISPVLSMSREELVKELNTLSIEISNLEKQLEEKQKFCNRISKIAYLVLFGILIASTFLYGIKTAALAFIIALVAYYALKNNTFDRDIKCLENKLYAKRSTKNLLQNIIINKWKPVIPEKIIRK